MQNCAVMHPAFVDRHARRTAASHFHNRKLNLSGEATEDYVCLMTAIETPQPVVRGPQVWPRCVTSHEYDRFRLRAYANAAVKECWLVLEPQKQIVVHRRSQGDQFAERAVHGPGGTLTSAAVSGFTVELDRLFAA